MNNEPEFPNPIRLRGRLFWRRTELEAYKRALLAYATGAEIISAETQHNQVETFVPSVEVTKEFGFGRRTLGRRIAGRSVAEVA